MEPVLKKRMYKRMTMSVKCMIFYKDKILLLQKKDKEGLRPWEFPGGGLEFGEDFATAARREVSEETGLDVELLGVAGLWSYARTPSVFLTGIIFMAKTDCPVVVLSEEHTDYVWVTPEEMKTYPLQDSLREALETMTRPNQEGAALQEFFCEHFQK